MRAYAKIDGRGVATICLPQTSWRVSDEYEITVDLDRYRPGWYRCNATFNDNYRDQSIGRGVEPRKEADRLAKLAAKPHEARTASPGIAGYQHMANMANEAIVSARQVNLWVVI